MVDSSQNLGDVIIVLSNGNTENGWFSKHIKETGRTAYCVQQGAPLILGDNNDYIFDENNSDIYIKASLADYFGRVSRTGNALKNELCVQLYIWELQGITTTNLYSAYGGAPDLTMAEYAAWKAEVTPKINAFYDVVSFANDTITLKPGESVTLTDTTDTLSLYTANAVYNDTGATLVKNGNKLTVTANSSSVSGTIQYRFDVDSFSGRPVLYYESNYTQDVITTGIGDPKYFNITLNVEKEGTLRLIKTSEDGIVSGFDFNVNGEGIDRNVKTGANGELTLNLLAGTYVVTEINVPGRYETPKSQTVTVEAGKTATVTFNNKLERSDFKLIKTSEDGIVAGFTFIITGNGQKFERTTDSKGEINIDGLVIYDSNNEEIEYTADEPNVPLRYKKPASQTFTLKKGETTTITFNNILEKGELKLIKTSEDGIVAGLTFRITGNGQTFNRTTDSKGEISVDGLVVYDSNNEEIKYTADETNVPSKFVVPASQTFTLEPNKTTTITFNNILKKFRIELTKVDGETGTAQGDASLVGAVYGVYKDGTLLDTYTIGSNGKVLTKYYVCAPGITVQEITPSPGYQLDPTVYTIDGTTADKFTIELNTLNKTVEEQVIKGKISLIKLSTDGSTGISPPEVGAEFEIYLESAGSYSAAKATEKDLLVIDDNGAVTTKYLPWGWYFVQQTKGWDGRELMRGFRVFIGEHEKTYHYIINNSYFSSHLKIVKTDAETGKTIPYAGAGFQLYNPDGSKIVHTITYPTKIEIDTFYTNDNGELITPEVLPWGLKYSLAEVQAPPGYVLDKTPIYFDVTQEVSEQEDGLTIIKVERPNKPQMGVVKISKTGPTFSTVREIDGMYVPVYETLGLPDTEYEFYADGDIVTPDGTVRYTDGELITTVITDINGDATSTPIYLGKLKIVEKTASHGMVVNSEPYYVELTYAGQEIEVTSTSVSFENEKQRIDIVVTKNLETDSIFGIGGNDEYINVKFGLFASEDITAADGSVIPKDGLIAVTGVKRETSYVSPPQQGDTLLSPLEVPADSDTKYVGKFDTEIPFEAFYVKEITTDEHYRLSDEIYPITAEYAGQDEKSITININNGEAIKNELIRASINTTKVNAEDPTDKLSGAVFGLYKDVNNNGIYEADIDIFTVNSEETDTGYYEINNVPAGNFFLHEDISPPGFAGDPIFYPVSITEDGQIVKFETIPGEDFPNNPTIMSFSKREIGKSEELPGAHLHIADRDGNILHEWVSGEEPHIIKQLPVGELLFVEDLAPLGYELTQAIPFTVTNTGIIQEIVMYNGLIKGSINTTKVNAEDPTDKLPGAVFGLYKDVNNNGIYEADIDTRVEELSETDIGFYEINGVPAGDFFLHEDTPPVGFAGDPIYYPVSITENGQVVKFETVPGEDFPNKPITVSFSKREIGKSEELPGAHLHIADKDGNILQEWISGEKPHIIKQLPVGDYMFVEDLAPLGYELAQAVPFTVTDTDIIQEVVMYDELSLVETPPQTGDSNNVIGLMLACGTALMAILFLTIVGIRRTGKNKASKHLR